MELGLDLLLQYSTVLFPYDGLVQGIFLNIRTTCCFTVDLFQTSSTPNFSLSTTTATIETPKPRQRRSQTQSKTE